MNIPTKKLRNGFEMPVFGLGTWRMGGKEEPDDSNNDQADINAIKAAIDLGITHIDTAEIYAAGKAERLVGQAIKEYDHKKLFIASKVQQTHLNYHDIKGAINNSLKRIGTDYLDLYYLHRYPGDDMLAECIQALDELADEGLVRHLAISNFNLEHTKRAQELAKHPITASQVHYSLKFREPEASGLLAYCQQNNIMLVAWRPLGMGDIARGRVGLESIPLVQEMAKKYGKTPAQIGINWLISQPNVVTLAKTSNIDHLKENLEAVSWQLDQEDAERLRREFPDQQTISDTTPLA